MKKYRILTTNGFRVWIEAKSISEVPGRFEDLYPTIKDYVVTDCQGCNPPPEQLQDEQPT